MFDPPNLCRRESVSLSPPCLSVRGLLVTKKKVLLSHRVGHSAVSNLVSPDTPARHA